jgi:hypothetical protein
MLENDSELIKILDKLEVLKETKQLSDNEFQLITSHIDTLNEILEKKIVYDKKMITIYNQIVEVFSDEQENI